MRTLIKLDRFFAWVLFIGMFLYFISGYGMTKGIISPALAVKLHLNYLTYIVLIAFIGHTSFAIHLAFKRWNFWQNGGKFVLVLFYLLFISMFIYVDRFYQKGLNNDDEMSSENLNTNPLPSSTVSSTQKTFTVSELAKYNGENGNPPYVAVDGVVYNMTGVFIGGFHFSHFAGKDLTNEFYSQHMKSSITKYPVVGILIK